MIQNIFLPQHYWKLMQSLLCINGASTTTKIHIYWVLQFEQYKFVKVNTLYLLSSYTKGGNWCPLHPFLESRSSHFQSSTMINGGIGRSSNIQNAEYVPQFWVILKSNKIVLDSQHFNLKKKYMLCLGI